MLFAAYRPARGGVNAFHLARSLAHLSNVWMVRAVPLLAVFKIFCDQVSPLTPVGEFLGR
jgi:hypothetical protein